MGGPAGGGYPTSPKCNSHTGLTEALACKGVYQGGRGPAGQGVLPDKHACHPKATCPLRPFCGPCNGVGPFPVGMVRTGGRDAWARIRRGRHGDVTGRGWGWGTSRRIARGRGDRGTRCDPRATQGGEGPGRGTGAGIQSHCRLYAVPGRGPGQVTTPAGYAGGGCGIGPCGGGGLVRTGCPTSRGRWCRPRRSCPRRSPGWSPG